MYPNRLSQASSTSDYPSSLSTFRNSALGLTDSPQLVMATASTPSTPSSSLYQTPVKQRKMASRSNLRQAVSTSSLKPVPEISSGRHSARPPSTGPPTPAKQPSLTLLSSQNLERNNALSQHARPPSHNPSRPPSQNKIHRKPPPSAQAEPSKSNRPRVDEEDAWEAELVRGARNLRVEDQPIAPKASKEQLREEQRKKDAEWEKSGMWENQENAARDAEDRTRREAGRSIGM